MRSLASACAIIAALAAAHAQPVRLLTSDPSDGAVLELPPNRIALHYAAAVDPVRSTLNLLDRSGQPVALISRGPDPTEPDGSSLEAHFRPLPDGDYSVRWNVFPHAGGESSKGEVHFKVDTVTPLKRAAPEPDPRTSKTSAKGIYRVSYQLPDGPARINTLHSWIVRIARADGNPLNNASLVVAGGMPIHAHGLPTVPIVIARGNEFLIQGVNFQMPGHWRLTLTIDSDAGRDQIFFDVVLNQ